MNHDVVIAGGSVAGLVCAREVAAGGHSVLVVEEDYEVGTPEHCGGLVSAAGLEELGVVPFGGTRGHRIESAQVFAPNGDSFTIDSKRQGVLEVSRRELDKQIAHQAQKKGAAIRVRTSFQGVTGEGVRTSGGEVGCRVFVDARGASSLVQKDRTGILPSAQYEIYADWIRKGSVEVYLDQERSPGFFAWVIPSGHGRGKVGIAGRGINAAGALDRFLGERKGYSVIRKIYAPIWTKGPIKGFVDGKTVIVGDAAGQAKPTTAGGIYSSGMGGLLAGRAISKFLSTGKGSDLGQYQREWKGRFGGEFERLLLARRILERAGNDTINKLFGSITPEIVKEASEKDDFDFHVGAIVRLLGAKGSARAVRTVVGGELRRILGRSGQG